MQAKKFLALIEQADNSTACAMRVPFDPKEVWGEARMPVWVSFEGHSYRTTTFRMGEFTGVPVNAKVRAATGVKPGQRVRVEMAPDIEARVVKVPPDLAAAMRPVRGAAAAWKKLSYTRQREAAELIEGAKAKDTRARRVAKIVKDLAR